MIVTAYNPSTDKLEKSYLSRAYSAGVSNIQVRNTDRFTNGVRIQIGESGQENTEIITVTTVTNKTDLVLANGTSFPHSASDPVYVLRYDQIKFYRSTTTVDGSYTTLATVDIDVDNDSLRTDYDDPNGISSYFYKISFYHSVTLLESDLSDPIAGEGYSRKQVGTLINDFLTEIGDLQQEYMTVPQIISLLNEVNEDITGQSRKPYRFLSAKKLASLTAGSDRVPLPEDIVKFDRVKYTKEDSTVDITKGNIPIISIEEMEYRQYNQNLIPNPLASSVTCMAIDYTDNELVVYPTPTTTQIDKLMIYYWSEFKVIKSLADVIQTPVARIYKMFLIGRYYRIRSKKESSFLAISDRYINDYSTEIVKLQRAQKVDVGTPMSFKPDVRTGKGLRRSL